MKRNQFFGLIFYTFYLSRIDVIKKSVNFSPKYFLFTLWFSTCWLYTAAQENAKLAALCDSVFSALQKKDFTELKPYLPGYKDIRGALDSADIEKLPHDILISQKTMEFFLAKEYKRFEKEASSKGLSLMRMDLIKTRHTIQQQDTNTFAVVRHLVYSGRKRHEIHWIAAEINYDWYLVEGLKYVEAPEDEYAIDFEKVEEDIEKKKEKVAKEKQKDEEKDLRETEQELLKQMKSQSAYSMRQAREQAKDSMTKVRSSSADSMQTAREEQKQLLDKQRAHRMDSMDRARQHKQDSLTRLREEREKLKPDKKK